MSKIKQALTIFLSSFSGLRNNGAVSGTIAKPAYTLANGETKVTTINIALPSGNNLVNARFRFDDRDSRWFQTDGSYVGLLYGSNQSIGTFMTTSNGQAKIIIVETNGTSGGGPAPAQNLSYYLTYYQAPF